MGGGNPQQQAAADLQSYSAGIQKRLADLTLPDIQKVIAQYMGDLGTPGSEPTSVANMFSQARQQTNQQFNQAEQPSSAAIATQAREMGLDYRPAAMQAAQGSAQTSLEQQRGSVLQNLSFQEAGAGLQQTDSLLARMGNIERMLASGAFGMGQNAIGDLGSMSQVNPWMGALGGAASGAATGATFGPYGAVIGGVAGGALGYFGSGG